MQDVHIPVGLWGSTAQITAQDDPGCRSMHPGLSSQQGGKDLALIPHV